MPGLLPVAVRVAGLGLAVAGIELAIALPAVEKWLSRPLARAVSPRLAIGFPAALLLASLGAAFAAMPMWAMSGGGLLAGCLLTVLLIMFAPLGDGADAMLIILLISLGCFDLMPATWMRVTDGWLIAGEVSVAYCYSGVEKLRVAAWRAGRQVALILNSKRYGVRPVAWHFLDKPWLAKLTSWGVIGLELSSPAFLLIGGRALVAWAICALLMHVIIAAIMGLGRFTWAFGAGLMCMLAMRNGS